MFSYETENIIRKIQTKVVTSDQRVSLRTILSAPIHDSVKVYFRATVTDTHERPKRFHTDQKTDTDDIASDIDLLLPTKHTFSKDVFSSLLTDAVHFQFNYLCRPRWTMKEFFFHNSTVKSLAELKKGFTYFSAYEYYQQILFRYIHRKGMTQIDSTTFDAITLKIDKLVLGESTADDFAILLKPLYDFVGYGREEDNPSIPRQALTLFFSDKGFHHISNRLESSLKVTQAENLSLSELRSYLSDIPATRTNVEDTEKSEEEPVQDSPTNEVSTVEGPADTLLSDEEKTKDVPEKPSVTDDRDSPPVIEEPFEEEPADVEKVDETIAGSEPSIMNEPPDMDRSYTDDELFRPIKKPFDEEDESTKETTRIETEDYREKEDQTVDQDDKPIGGTPSEDELSDEEISTEEKKQEDSSRPGTIDDDLPDIFSKKEDQGPREPTLHPLELLIEDDERKRFIRKLFNGDAAYFEVVVQTLNKITSWKEASLYLDEIFLVNGVDPYSTDSVHFTDKVYTRFSQKSML